LRGEDAEQEGDVLEEYFCLGSEQYERESREEDGWETATESEEEEMEKGKRDRDRERDREMDRERERDREWDRRDRR